MGLSPEQIAQLLKEDAAEQQASRRGPKVDPTLDRSAPAWFKLPHHICLPDCPHRQDPANPTNGRACWNPDCKDTRPTSDRGTNIIAQVKGQWICRYCYVDGYLL